MSNEGVSLNHRESLAVAGVVAGKSATQALLDAGYSESVARTQQKAILGKDRVKRAIEQAMDEAGISPRLLAKTMREGLEAERSVFHAGKRIAREPDHSARRKYCELALDVRGDLERQSEDQEETWEAILLRVRARGTQQLT